MINSISPEFYQVGLYLRFSIDDGKESDSSSIQGQRLVLENFCRTHNLRVTDIYIDDGWSGSNFERPEFKRMISDIEDKKINLVLTKDLSRLGRDYILAGHYTEIYFPEHGVRYIAVVDDYDSDRPSELGPIKNMFNDWYARDISKKIKTVFVQKQKKGEFISNTPPYGYIKDPKNKHHFVIDPIASPIVKEIFDLTLKGFSRAQVAKILTKRKIPVPSAHLKMDHSNFKKRPNWEYTWIGEMIRTMTKNQVYVGDMISRKSECLNHKTQKTIKYSKGSGQRIIVPNTHEPLVSREDFEKIQTTLSFYNRISDKENFFKGLIFCAECNYRMQIAGNEEKKKIRYYQCKHRKRYTTDCTNRSTMSYKEVKKIITSEIKKVFSLFQDKGKLAELIKEKSESDNSKKKLLDEKNKISNRLKTLTKLTKKIYEDYISDDLSQNIYKQLTSEYKTEEISLAKRLEEIESILFDNKNQETSIEQFRRLADNSLNFETLTQEIVTKLIKRIEIGQKKIIDDQEVREINIYFYHLGN